MEKNIIDYFQKITTLTKEEVADINSSMTMVEYAKDSVLLKEGAYSKDSYFVNKGCVRKYRIVDGEEVTLDFFIEGQWILSLADNLPALPSPDYLVCAEDTILVLGNEAKAQALFSKHPRLEAVSRSVIENVFVEQMEKTASFRTDTPEQRYVKLVEQRPELFQRIPQYQIASYIGVKPESLSRIRRRLADGA